MKTLRAIAILISLFVFSALSADEIHEAVKNNDLDRVKILITKTPDLINSKDDNGRTPLHWACRGTSFEIVSCLVKNGTDVNARDVNNIAPIHSTASRGNIEATGLLLEYGANVNIVGRSGNTALHYASWDGFDKMVLFLIENGAFIESLNVRKRTPLLIAAREDGGIEVIKALVENGANINAVDAYGDTPLTLAAWRGYEDIVNFLLVKNAEIPVSGQKGVDILKFALNKRLWKLYHEITLRVGDISELLPHGIIPLHIAVKGGSFAIVDDLLKKGYDVNARDIYGYAPLHYAAKSGRLEVVKTLEGRGANL